MGRIQVGCARRDGFASLLEQTPRMDIHGLATSNGLDHGIFQSQLPKRSLKDFKI
jgi:hypothetical protein